MEEGSYKCSICGNIDFNLVDAIGQEEIIKVCEDCAKKEKLPIIHRTSPEELSTIQRFYASKGKEMQKQEQEAISHLSTKKTEEDKELEKILKQSITKKDFPDLIDNFHWHIQHARRIRKLSAKQLAEAIAEKEIIVELAEEGKLPDNHEQIITKLEQYLRVRLKKEVPKVDEKSEEKPEIIEEAEEGSWLSSTKNYLKKLTKSLFEADEEESKKIINSEVEKEIEKEKISLKEAEKAKEAKKITEKEETKEITSIEKREKSERDLFEEYYKRSMRY